MQKRLFVAVTLPEDVKKRLFRIVEKEYVNLPVKWVRKENLHLTLNFLGYVSEENLPEICESVREAVKNMQPFELEFQKIEAGPGGKIKKMVWATGERSSELSELKHQMDKWLGFHAREKREYRPHITLGRIKREAWRKISPEPDVGKNFVFFVPVSSVELFESKFEKGKRIYYVLESFPLK